MITQIIYDATLDEYILDLGEDMMNELGWNIGDSIEWSDNGDGTWTVSKKPDEVQFLEEPEKITRLEVIGPDGREYVRYFESGESMDYMIQDDGQTLKIIIKN